MEDSTLKLVMISCALLILLAQVAWLCAVIACLRRGGFGKVSGILAVQRSSNAEALEAEGRLVAARQMQLARPAAWLAWTALLVFGVEVLWEAYSQRVSSGLSLLVQTVMTLWIALVCLFPKALASKEALPISYIVCMACLCGVAYAEQDFERQSVVNELVTLMAILFSGLCLRLGVLALTHGCLALCCVAAQYSRGADFDEGQRSLWSTITNQVLYLVIKLLLFSSVQRLLETSSRRELQAKIGHCPLLAVSAALSSVCECVVELDESLRMRGPSETLATLLRLGEGKSLEGEALLTFLEDDGDRYHLEMVLRQMIGPADQDSSVDAGVGLASAPTKLMPCSLCDSTGTNIKVVLLHIPFAGPDGRQHHLIGLCSALRMQFQAPADGPAVAPGSAPDGANPSFCKSDAGGGGLGLGGGVLTESDDAKSAAVGEDDALKAAQGQGNEAAGAPVIDCADDAESSVCSSVGLGDIDQDGLASESEDTFDENMWPDRDSGSSAGSSRSHSSSSSSRALREKPQLQMSVEVYIGDGLPVRWIGRRLLKELGMSQQVEGSQGEWNFCDSLCDGGDKLLAQIAQVVANKEAKRRLGGPFVVSLGVFEFLRFKGGVAEEMRRKVWVNFFLPFRVDDDGRNYAAIGVGLQEQPISQRLTLQRAPRSSRPLDIDARARSHELLEARAFGRARGQPRTSL